MAVWEGSSLTRRGGNGDNGGKCYGLVKLAKCSVKRVACKPRQIGATASCKFASAGKMWSFLGDLRGLGKKDDLVCFKMWQLCKELLQHIAMLNHSKSAGDVSSSHISESQFCQIFAHPCHKCCSTRSNYNLFNEYSDQLRAATTHAMHVTFQKTKTNNFFEVCYEM